MALLDKNTYEPETRDILLSTWRQVWHFFPVFALFLAATILVLVTNGLFATGSLVMAALCLVTAAVGAWAVYHHTVKHPSIQYTVHGVTVKFTSPEYYVPRQKMADFLEEMIMPFKRVIDDDQDPMDLVHGVTLVIQPERPADPLGRVEQAQMVGLTFPGRKKTSYVYGPHALNSGGAGYEMKLQACGILFPGRPEGEDIEWMREHDLL